MASIYNITTELEDIFLELEENGGELTPELEEFSFSDRVDMILRVGNNHYSLIGKFSITYIFEVLEALYHLKYGTRK